MELKFEKIEDSGVNVDEVVANLTAAEPGKYVVASGLASELNKLALTLRGKGYTCRVSKTADAAGEPRVNRAGVSVTDYVHNLVVTTPAVEAPAAKPEPVEAPAEATEDSVPTSLEEAAEAMEPKGRKR